MIQHVGNILEILAAIGIVVEVTPIKISPLKWIGNRLNKDTLDRIDRIQKQVNNIEYKNAMKDLADIRNRINGYGMMIVKGEKLDYDILLSAQHDLDMYDYYKETYKYMDINGRKVKINGEVEMSRKLIQEQMKER